MEKLPKEILIEIFNYLDGHSLFNASKVLPLWSDIINGSIEITNRFCYKVYSGYSIMPDFMDYESLRAYYLGAPLPKPTDTSIKIQKFYPNLRHTEFSDITDEDGKKFDDIMAIMNEYGRLWKTFNIHEVKLKSIENFSDMFDTLLNVAKMKIVCCEAIEDADEEVLLSGKVLPHLKELEVQKIDFKIFRILKHCEKIETLKMTSVTRFPTCEFGEFLMSCKNLKNLELYSRSKESFDTSLNFPFALENLNIDRSDLYNSRNEPSSFNFDNVEDFVLKQKKSLKTLKFKGQMSDKNVAKIAKELKIKELNVHLSEKADGKDGIVEIGGKNRSLESLTVIGSVKDVLMMVKYYEGIKNFEFYASIPDRLNELFIILTSSLPTLQNIKIYSPLEVPNLVPEFHRLKHLEYLRIVLKNVAEIPQVLKCCPNLKKLTLSSKFIGDFPDEDLTLAKIEELEINVQMSFGENTMLTNLNKILRFFPNVSSLSINSQLDGTLKCDSVELKNLTNLKLDFTCTDEQCNNMYKLIRNCPNLKTLEMNSRLIGELSVDGPKMEHLESLTVMGIAETLNAFKNLTNFMKISPKLKKVDFWVRGNSAESYVYEHSDEISKWKFENFDSVEELKIWRFQKTEIGILNFLCGSCKNVKRVEWNLKHTDLEIKDMESVLEKIPLTEELSFGKEYDYTRAALTTIKNKLLNLKKFIIFAWYPIHVQKAVNQIFESREIEIIYNPQCLEEWKDDEIERV